MNNYRNLEFITNVLYVFLNWILRIGDELILSLPQF